MTSEIERTDPAAVSVWPESIPTLSDLIGRWSEEGTPGLSLGETRHLLHWAKKASASLDQVIVMLWLGKAHLNLGHKSWREMVQSQELVFRPSREQRREWHYLMYWQHGMPSRAVAEVTGVDQKTVIRDAETRHEELLAAGLESPERDRVITEITGRTRRLPDRREPEVTVEADVVDLDGDDVIDIEEVPPGRGTPTAAADEPPTPGAPAKRKPWPDEFAVLTRDMERTMERARQVFADRRLKTHLSNVPEGDVDRWTGWSTELDGWVFRLNE